MSESLKPASPETSSDAPHAAVLARLREMLATAVDLGVETAVGGAVLSSADRLARREAERLRRRALFAETVAEADQLTAAAREVEGVAQVATSPRRGGTVDGVVDPAGPTTPSTSGTDGEVTGTVLPVTVLPIAGDKQLSATWVPAKAPATRVRLVPGENPAGPAAQTRTLSSADELRVHFTGLTNNQPYTVVVEQFAAQPIPSGAKPIAAGHATARPAAPLPAGAPLHLGPLDRATLSRAERDLRATAATAQQLGAKWRFDFLRDLALGAARNAMAIDARIDALAALDASKTMAAGQLAQPALADLQHQLKDLAKTVKQVPAPDLDAVARRVAEAATNQLVLARLLLFLTRESAIGFWVGLFGALIDDIAALDRNLARTGAHVRAAFGSGALAAELQEVLADVVQDAQELVDELALPLSAAAGVAIGDAQAALKRVLGAFDEPLLAPLGVVGDAVPDVLAGAAGDLSRAVDELVGLVQGEVQGAFANVRGLGAAAGLYEALVITWLVLPILAALAVGLASGPIGAALLAAAVCLAAQELVHLVARLLTGPVTQGLQALDAQVDEAVGQLTSALTEALQVPDMKIDAGLADLTAGQLAQLSALLPKAYLDDAAATLAEARDGILRDATGLCAAAERALGLEAGTVFGVIDPALRPATGAPELAGGRDAGRYGGEKLVRDLEQLAQSRVQLPEPKEQEVTLRLSVRRLLGEPAEAATGTGAFQRLLAGEDVAVVLREAVLLDRAHPGLYRALVSDVRVTAALAAPLTGALSTLNLPVHLTSVGASRTRVRRSAQASAPPPVHEEATRVGALWTGAPGLTSRRRVDPGKRWIALAADPVAARRFAELILSAEDTSGLEAARNALVAIIDPGEPSTTWAPETLRDALALLPLTHRLRELAAEATGLALADVPGAPKRPRQKLEALTDEVRWAGSRLEEDRDPAAAALGFATLVRDHEDESAVFNLLAGTASGAPLPASGAAAPAETLVEALGLPGAAAGQTRPFEHRGLEGTYLLRLPAGDDLGAVLGLAGLPAASVPQITDLVLEVTVRALHDADLAAALRAGRELQDELLDELGQVLGKALEVSPVADLVGLGPSDRRTVRFSMREHRDGVLRLLQAARAADPAVLTGRQHGIDWEAVRAAAPLAPDEPLRTIGEGNVLELSFDDQPLAAATVGKLAKLAGTIPVSAAALGFDLLSGAVDAGVVGVAVSVIPTRAGATKVARPMPLPDALGVRPIAVAADGHRVVLAAGSGMPDTAHVMSFDPATGWDDPAVVAKAGGPFHALELVVRGDELIMVVGRRDRIEVHRRTRAGWQPPTSSVQPHQQLAACLHDGDVHIVSVFRQDLSYDDELINEAVQVLRVRADGTLEPRAHCTGLEYTDDLALASDGTNLHVVVTAAGYRDGGSPGWSRARHLWHTMWNGHLGWCNLAGDGKLASFGQDRGWRDVADVFGETDERTCVSCAADGDRLHVLYGLREGSDEPHLVHAVRSAKGTWTRTSRVLGLQSVAEVDCTVAAGGRVHAVVATTRVTPPGGVPAGSTGPGAPSRLVDELLHLSCDRSGAWSRVGSLHRRPYRIVRDPLAAVELLAAGPLGDLLPAHKGALVPMGARLVVSPLDREPVAPSALFDADNPGALRLDMGRAMDEGLVHDVLLSVTYTVPVAVVEPAVV